MSKHFSRKVCTSQCQEPNIKQVANSLCHFLYTHEKQLLTARIKKKKETAPLVICEITNGAVI